MEHYPGDYTLDQSIELCHQAEKLSPDEMRAFLAYLAGFCPEGIAVALKHVEREELRRITTTRTESS